MSRVVIQQFDGNRGDAELHQQRRQHAGFAQQDHPAERANRFAHPERNQAQDEQQRTRAPRASFAMIQAMGNASSKVSKVAITDITAVRTNTCQ
jgi:hypothetical protein